MLRTSLTLFLVLATVGLAEPAKAALLPADLPEFPDVDQFLTVDTATGLEWLDINLSEWISFNALIGGSTIRSGSLKDTNPITDFGFRHATIDEALVLFENAGIPNIDATTTANLVPVETLLSLVGITAAFSSSPLRAISLAITATDSPTPNRIVFLEMNFFGVGSASVFTSEATSPDTADPTIGHLLVRSTAMPVPTPATLPLLLVGLGLLLAFRPRLG